MLFSIFVRATPRHYIIAIHVYGREVCVADAQRSARYRTLWQDCHNVITNQVLSNVIKVLSPFIERLSNVSTIIGGNIASDLIILSDIFVIRQSLPKHLGNLSLYCLRLSLSCRQHIQIRYSRMHLTMTIVLKPTEPNRT